MPLPNLESRAIVLGLRITQAAFATIVLGLTAYVANWWTSWYHAFSPSQVNFLIFSSVWTALALLYLILVPWRFPDSRLHHKYAVLAVEGVTMVFWFAGFVALAAFLSDRVCFGTVCESARAATVFAAFEWLVFACTTVLAVLHDLRSGSTTEADPRLDMREAV